MNIVFTYQGMEVFNQQKYDKAIKLFSEAIHADSLKMQMRIQKEGFA